MASPLNSLAEREDERKGERDTTLFSLMLLTNKVFVAPLLACRANGSSLLCPAIRRPHSLMGRERGPGSICLTKVGKTGRQSAPARRACACLRACVLSRHVARSFHLKKPPLFTRTVGRTFHPAAASTAASRRS